MGICRVSLPHSNSALNKDIIGPNDTYDSPVASVTVRGICPMGIWFRTERPLLRVAYLEVRATYNWLHNCSYDPLIRPLSRVS